ncbi:hypothetical protein [Burkholderia contaminans]|uniref:hypothetical protein n=2 Tax=Burkholderia cepacia complex TaxID=87882 RepID=UPI002D7F0E58|nr:hypothetical protein [Burkholderia contaminans]
MKNIRIIIGALGVTLSIQANAGCDSIITHGLRNIEITESHNSVEALQYANHCEFDQNQKSDSEITQAHVEIIGEGSGGAGYNRSTYINDIKSWCDTRKGKYAAGAGTTTQSQTFYQGAVSAWQACNQLNADSLRVDPQISPDRRIVDIGIVYTGPTQSGVLLYNIATEGFSCKAVGPRAGDFKFPVPVTNLAVQVHCVRQKSESVTIQNQLYQHTPSGSISVQSASHPFQLAFAEEYDPPAPLKEVAALRQELRNRELPVGSVVSSALPPSTFLSGSNPQYSADRWVVAEGQKLPDGTLFEKISGSKTAPDLRAEQNSYAVLDVINTDMKHGQLVQTAITDAGRPGAWHWFASGRWVEGHRVNNDYEQDENRMVTYIDGTSGAVVAYGQTLNWKHSAWGSPSTNGVANVLGISLKKNSLYYYVKVN